MSLIDLVARVATGPMGRVVEAPVRDVVDEVLRQQPIASAADLKALSNEIDRLSGQVKGLEERLKVLVDAVNEIQQPNADEDPAALAGAAAREAMDSMRAEIIAAAVAAAEAAAAKVLAAAPAAAAPVEEAPAEEAPAEEAPAEAAPAVEEAPEAPPAERGCKVPDCERKYRARGFCALHYQSWRRGTLEGYVSPEALIQHGQQVLQVPNTAIGSAYKITGRGKKLKVKIDNKAVDYTLNEG